MPAEKRPFGGGGGRGGFLGGWAWAAVEDGGYVGRRGSGPKL